MFADTPIPPNQRVNLKGLLRKNAVWAFRKFQFEFPDIEAELYQLDWECFIWVKNCTPDRLAELAKHFRDKIKPVGTPVAVTDAAPSRNLLVPSNDNPASDFWLDGMPLNVGEVSRLLAFAMPHMPMGGLDFRHDADSWIFRSKGELTEQEKNQVIAAHDRLGLTGQIQFEVTPPPPGGAERIKREHDLDLTPAAYLRGDGTGVKRLVERDEDGWRDYISKRAEMVGSPVRSNQVQERFGCLFDLSGTGDIRLSELLTLYDRIDIMPNRHEPSWPEKLGISTSQLQELVSLGRVRLILPFSTERYQRPELLDAVVEADPAALILSRQLAIRTIEHGMVKQPLLYAPLTTRQRIALLSALGRIPAGENWQVFLKLYSDIFQRQHYHYMFRGALAAAGCGVGAYLGEMFRELKGVDARIELSTTGAAIEWATALGSTFIPRNFGGFDESPNAHIIASFLNRAPIQQRHIQPFANRMRTVVNGLLTVSDAPAMEVARNFGSAQVYRFREVATKLMTNATSQEELQAAVDHLNEDVRKFDRKSAIVRNYKIDYILSGGVGMAVDTAIDTVAFTGVSLGARWLFEHAKKWVPQKFKGPLDELMPILIACATCTSTDAVVVSRSKEVLQQDRKS